ncbi:hypothetical protein ACFRMN_15690 [Streptomyces sp. NPDC056835]|uniref:hypothetical protein n=1 Tax=Streptomyces sp. NPDC056835 TaxID=3345956 RepID=UPI003693D205
MHRHLVLEEAWQILLSPATSELIQRLLKNSRKAGLSLDVVMHTLSDQGDGRARDLARLCEVAHVGRLGPEEAAIVGALLGLPAWAIAKIPTLDPGQAVWKVGPGYVDIVQTIITEEEAGLTDTSSRRRKAQEAQETVNAADLEDADEGVDPDEDALATVEHDFTEPGGDWDWDMPPNVIDGRHQDVLQAAREGRCGEAADLAALGEREDITVHGINSDEAAARLSTRAQVADLCGSPAQAAGLRATVTRMGKDTSWFENSESTTPEWHRGPESPTVLPPDDEPTPTRRRWPYVAAIAALSIAVVVVWQTANNEQHE